MTMQYPDPELRVEPPWDAWQCPLIVPYATADIEVDTAPSERECGLAQRDTTRALGVVQRRDTGADD